MCVSNIWRVHCTIVPTFFGVSRTKSTKILPGNSSVLRSLEQNSTFTSGEEEKKFRKPSENVREAETEAQYRVPGSVAESGRDGARERGERPNVQSRQHGSGCTPNDHQSSRARQSNSTPNRRTAVASLRSNRSVLHDATEMRKSHGNQR